jgi:hypothetical protein
MSPRGDGATPGCCSSRSPFVARAGFLRLHALATPGVLLGRNKGFELATPVGLVVACGVR